MFRILLIASEIPVVVPLSPLCRGITGQVDAKELGMKIVEDYAKSWTWILV